jgi:hypothetical protein
MDADLAAWPDDIDALKAVLTSERARIREVTVERDVRGSRATALSYTGTPRRSSS